MLHLFAFLLSLGTPSWAAAPLPPSPEAIAASIASIAASRRQLRGMPEEFAGALLLTDCVAVTSPGPAEAVRCLAEREARVEAARRTADRELSQARRVNFEIPMELWTYNAERLAADRRAYHEAELEEIRLHHAFVSTGFPARLRKTLIQARIELLDRQEALLRRQQAVAVFTGQDPGRP
jgi:hypothetical protein